NEAFSGTGEGVHSDNGEISLNGLETPEAKKKITAWLEAKSLGSSETQYKLRDWLFSRQRYWGEPFPVLHGPNGVIRAVDDEDLPVTLPPLDDFRPRPSDDPEAPPQTALSKAPEEWKQVTIDGVTYERELNTMPQWAGSCWYYLRYIDPKNSSRMVSKEAEEYWMAPTGIDLYVGGVEHAVLHLLYARFWHKVLFDLGEVSTREPFQRLVNQGYIQAYAYQDERGVYLDANKIEEEPNGKFTYEGKVVSRSLGKMGKSLKNSVSPDEIIEHYGCDTLRLYEMYLGPIEQSKPWSTKAIVGVHRFLQRLWRNLVDEDTNALLVDDAPSTGELKVQLHKTIAAVTDDMQDMRFNTAIARLIELNNALVGLERVPRDVAEAICLMTSPMAPHIAEELWRRMGHQESLAYVTWPAFDPGLLVEDEIDIVVQVMGKKRGSIRVPADAAKDAIEALALEDAGVQRHTEGKTVRKVIYVPGKLINIVAN
ncbi:MAG: class I tRNA ligase family protein, partial [Candidatus Eisenbacteria bacterium]|nr:class I tRNA ligase family protein [Candidatus Eisenbacteria bacterium]